MGINKILHRKLASWDKFIFNMEHDIHGRQIPAYEVMRHSNQQENDVEHRTMVQKLRG